MSDAPVVVPLAPGFEEIEAVTIVDVLRRAGIEVLVAGLTPGPVTGSHGVTVTADIGLDDVDPARVSMVVLPGGMPGARHLRDDDRVQALLRAVRERDGWTAAICAAPIALAASGVTEGRVVTCYPGFGEEVPAAELAEDRVVVDGRLITSRGPGTALEFALTLVEILAGAEKAAELEQAMLVRRAEPARRA